MADWEFDYNLNVAATHALMQCGLRMCPNLKADSNKMEIESQVDLI